MKTGTLKELNVKPGDVVRWHGQDQYNDMTVVSAKVRPAGEPFAGQVGANLSGYGRGIFGDELFTIISRATDTPTLWRDMTPEEKGALLLHQHKLGELQRWYEGEWLTIGRWDAIYDHCAYRIKPQPKVEVVTMSGHLFNNEWYFETHRKDVRHTHCITFNTIDGDIPHGTYTNECGHTITVDKL